MREKETKKKQKTQVFEEIKLKKKRFFFFFFLPLTIRSPSLTPPAMLHARIFSSVDLPAPEGPMHAVRRAARHSPVTERRIVFHPPPTAGT